MNNKALALAIFAIAAPVAHAADNTPAPAAPAASAVPESAPASAPVSTPATGDGNFCLYPGSPPSDVRFHSLGRVKASKGTYGGVRDELPAFVAEARAKGADAVSNYNGAQRFGFWPWRMVHPVLTGIAIKFDAGKAPDCAATGGTTMAAVIATNVEPPRH